MKRMTPVGPGDALSRMILPLQLTPLIPLLVVFLIFSWLAVARADDLVYLKHLRNARIHAEAQEWDQSIECYRQAIGEHPEGVHALKELANIYLIQKKDMKLACPVIEKLSGILSEDPDVQSLASFCESLSAKKEEIRQMDPKNLQEVRTPKIPRVSETIEKKWKLYAKALEAFGKKDFENSLLAVDGALQESPDEISYLILKARVLLGLKREADAKSIVARIEELGRDKTSLPPSMAQLALVYDELGETEKAFDLLKKSAVSVYQGSTVSLLVDFCEKHGTMKEARDLLESLLRSCERCADPLWSSALSAAKAGKIERAVTFLNYLKRVDPNDHYTYFWLGHYCVQLDKLDQVVENYEKGLKLHHGDINVYYNLGYAYYNLGDFPRSVLNYEKAVKLSPSLPEAHLNLGMAYVRVGEWVKADAALKRSLALEPSFYQAYYYLAIAAGRMGDQKAAREYSKKYKEMKDR